MAREWIRANRLSVEYEEGVDSFIEHAVQHAQSATGLICPCLQCCCFHRVTAEQMKDHLYIHGFDPGYTCWIFHGETREASAVDREDVNVESNEPFENCYEGDTLEEMTRKVEENVRDCPKMFEKLLSDSETPLYSGCKTFTLLSGVLRLYNLKACNGWSDKSFTDLLALLKEMLPDGNVLPARNYEAKKILSTMGMGYEKIHACPNDCILFRNDYASLDRCPNPQCKAPRYTRNKVPSKVMWYFPVIPRFRRMFNDVNDAKNLTWHADERIDDGLLRHPADSPQWRVLDGEFPDFGDEARNLRLALSADGMNPHNSGSYSVWPVILVMYNLPPWLYMKRKGN